MTQYRLLERLNLQNEWQPDGVVYLDAAEETCFFYRNGQEVPYFIDDLDQLGEKHYPREKDSTFRWGEISEWTDEESFSPEAVIQTPLSQPQEEQYELDYDPANLPQEIKEWLGNVTSLPRDQEIRLKRDFVIRYEKSYSMPRLLVEAFWQRWAMGYDDPPFIKPEHNVALLLYARAFGLAVEETPTQKAYLARYKSLYAPLMRESGGWGARASLSEDILVMLDSPVMHVWVYKEADIPQKIAIVGRGLDVHRDKIFSDAFVTAMRVQASPLDVFNSGLITIERSAKQKIAETLDIRLPVLGANAPLADVTATDAAMSGLIRQLRELERETGFVQIHEVDRTKDKHFQAFFRRLARRAARSGEAILWAPDSTLMESEEDLMIVHPILTFFPRVTLFGLSLNPELLGTASWNRLVEAYKEEVVDRIAMDAHIRRDFYRRRATGLRDEKEQWDKSDEYQRQQRWGPTVTLNQRFDDETGLSIWLQPPDIIPTERYFEENVPQLIQSYEGWQEKMQTILDSLRIASQRHDYPFQRLITTRFFDAALRGQELIETPRIQKLYREWANGMADLLRFEWRKKLRSIGANLDDLFTVHTTFNLIQVVDDYGANIIGLRMVPYTLLDAKRSVVLFDPDRRFMVVNDASDYPQDVASTAPSEGLEEALLQYSDSGNIDQLVSLLRNRLIQDPGRVGRQIVELLRPQVADQALTDDSERVRRHYEEGLSDATSLPRILDLAESAMRNQALLTARESLDRARAVLPELLECWNKMRAAMPQKRRDNLPPIPSKEELECRLYLLAAIAECLTTEHMVKDHLPAIYRAPRAGGRTEIIDALAAADNANRGYTEDWIEYLEQWELNAAYSKLMRDLPSEQDLMTPEQHSAMRAFDAIELVQIAADLRVAMETLSHVQETRTTALVKLGPALERALLPYSANVVYGGLTWLFEILTGRQVVFGRDV
jgi:hypothetical protein